VPDGFGFDDLDLDRLRARSGAKWHKNPGLLNAWVADMDLPPSPIVAEAIRRRADADDLGYPDWGWPDPHSPVCELFAERAASRYGWRFDIGHVREFCDVVQGVQATLMVATQPGDGVVLHTPSYPPLWHSLADMGRRQIDVPASIDTAGVHFDHDALEARLEHEPARVLLLCHPHNPTGHRFTRAELERLVGIAHRFDLLIISDEIHADLTFGSRHIPIASIDGAADRTVTLHSASKAFNLAGMRHALACVGSAEVRRQFAALPDHLLGAVNLIAAEVTEAVWRNGDVWLDAVMAHLDRNRHLAADLLRQHLPGIVHRPSEATYLAWLDCRGLGMGDAPVDEFRRRGVELSDGNDFGPLGAGHVRLNTATSASVLELIVRTMAAA
jgi:cystathionine beta-lyase